MSPLLLPRRLPLAMPATALLSLALTTLALAAPPIAGAGSPASPATSASTAAAWSVIGSDRMNLVVQQNGGTFLTLRTRILGPGWRDAALTALPDTTGGKRRYTQSALTFPQSQAAVDLRYEVEKTAPNIVRIAYDCTPNAHIETFRVPTAKPTDPYATFGLFFRTETSLQKGECSLKTTDGKTARITLPPSGMLSHDSVESVELTAPSGEILSLAFSPALTLSSDAGEIRLFAKQPAVAGQPARQTITLTTPADAAFEADNRWVRTESWFPLKCDNDFATPSPISLADWQDRPAGKRGFLQIKDDRYVFEDGTPAKLWGVNLINGGADKALLDRWAVSLPKYGFNLARLVAFARPNTPKRWSHFVKLQDVDDGLKFDASALELFDYGFARLKENGVYVGSSPFYGWYPTPADKGRLLAYDEAVKLVGNGMPASGSFYGATCIMKDVQDLIIAFHVKLLEHVNPHTGLRYADDPALAFVELQNEENTFLQLFNLGKMLDQAPAYRKVYYADFAAWLAKRYGSQEALAKAWGNALKPDETLAAANISPVPPYFAGNTASRRIADQMAYIAHTQRDYYQRFVAAVRKTGYKGGLSASCWQGINWLGHLHNVALDREVGQIDRHNYATTDFKNPGTGLMSAGLQAVADRPFSYSEWHGGHLVGMHPDMPVVAAYGMGLQGWDLSMGFAYGIAGAMPRADRGINNTFNSFGVLSQSPALARMVRRQDLREGDIVAARRVSLPALDRTGDVGFTETFSLLGGANNKRFAAAVPNEALAAGRVVLEFVDGPVDQPVVDRSAPYIDARGRVIRSTTGQLNWDYSQDGFFTIDTAGTQAAVGYIGGRTLTLGRSTIETANPYAHIYVTASEPDKTLADSKRVLITTHARVVDPGTRFDAFSERPIIANEPKGDADPVIIEPVKATLTLKKSGPAKLYALDHDGRLPAGATPLPCESVPGGLRFTLDGEKTHAVYYLLEFAPAK